MSKEELLNTYDVVENKSYGQIDVETDEITCLLEDTEEDLEYSKKGEY